MVKKRRPIAKYVTLAAVVCLLLTLPGSLLAQKLPFEGVTLKVLIGAGAEAPMFTTHVDYLEKKLGVKFKFTSEPDPGHYQLIMKDWMMGGGSYDIVTLLPRWNAEFMGMGYLLPLTDYFKGDPEAWKDYEDIVEKYRTLYSEWGGEIYAIVIDGDAFILYYRKDMLTNPDYQARFQQKYGYKLPVPPRTWDKLIDVAEFFAGWDWDNDGKVEYGAYFLPLGVPTDTIIAFMGIFSTMSNGLAAFDEKVNPQINNEYGVEALKILKRVCDTAPPGYLGIDWVGSWRLLWEGTTVMNLTSGDAGRFLLSDEHGEGCGMHWKGKIGYSVWPGKMHEGEFVAFSPLFWGRIMGVSRYTKYPDACAAVLRELLRPERKMLAVSNWKCFSEPYSYSAADASTWTIPIDQEYLDTYLSALDHGVPHIMLPGAEEYHRAVGREIVGYLQGEFDEKTTLARIEKAWQDITDRQGRAKQEVAWSTYLEKMLQIGFRLK